MIKNGLDKFYAVLCTCPVCRQVSPFFDYRLCLIICCHNFDYSTGVMYTGRYSSPLSPFCRSLV